MAALSVQNSKDGMRQESAFFDFPFREATPRTARAGRPRLPRPRRASLTASANRLDRQTDLIANSNFWGPTDLHGQPAGG